MGVFTKNSPGQLVGNGLADHGGPSINQDLNSPGVIISWLVCCLPVRVAPTGDVASYVEYVLGGKGQSRKGPVSFSLEIRLGVLTKGVQVVIDLFINAGHGNSPHR